MKPLQEFCFVASNGRDVKYNDETRTIIRVRAMTNAAATRKAKTDAASAVKKRGTSVHARASVPTHARTLKYTVPTSLSSSSYETATRQYGVDIRSLALLTNFNIGRATIIALSRRPSLLFSLLQQPFSQRATTDSYIHFIPQRYGHSQALTAAVDSVLCALRARLHPSREYQACAYKKHAEALQTLRVAVKQPCESSGADLLCATQLVALREVLESRQTHDWEAHLKGCLILAKHRKPSSYRYDFDKSLLLSYAGAITFDALINDYHCHLAEPEWTTVYRSLIVESEHLTERSTLSVDLRCVAFRLPGLWCDVTAAMRGDDIFDDEVLAELAARACKLRDDVLHWFVHYHHYPKSARDEDMHRELSGAASEILAITMRLLAALCEDEAIAYEKEAQVWAANIMKLQQTTPKYGWIYSTHELGAARSLYLTAADWQGANAYPTEYDRRIALRTRYHEWSEHRCDEKFDKKQLIHLGGRSEEAKKCRVISTAS